MNRKTFWGAIKQIISQLSMYATPITFIFSALTAWKIVIYPRLAELGYDPTLWQFFTIIMLFFLIAGVLEWKYSVPSFFRSWTALFYVKDNPLRQDIEELKESIERLETQIHTITDIANNNSNRSNLPSNSHPVARNHCKRDP